ncbi:hypothetical protein [Gordonia sp. SND2]|uniref:DUF7171 family protein n=1 Tax=Gordonia sp. SND2 TaxID=3388659 RepID=UPI00398B8141
MAKVTKHNGEGGTSSGLFFHQYSGKPIDQYEWPNSDGDPRANIGDVFVLTVRAEVVKVVEDEVKDGRRQTIGFKVIDSQLGKMVAKADGNDPNQTSIDDMGEGSSDDYGDYSPPQFDADQPTIDATEVDGPNHNQPFKVV